MWLRACSDRLAYLANAKNSQVQAILSKLKYYRTITFCTSIAQSELLGKNCIHSKNKSAQETLKAFNDSKIKHITACHMLNEGVNLTNCKYGIFANINASETIQIQRVGRALRHKNPILIIPFFRDTREEEIVRKWMENYNKDLIKVIYKPEEL
jgi:superfamily II DNA or RNA helicase